MSNSEYLPQNYDFTLCLRPNGSTYGTAGRCRKGIETSPSEELGSGIKGRVPRDDPKEPLGSGNTPLEKAKAKLKTFESRISDPDRSPSEHELEQYGKLKMAIEEFENRRDGRKKGGLFGGTDNSDIDTSKTRGRGKVIRELLPTVEERRTLVRAFALSTKLVTKRDPLLRRRSNATLEEIERLKRNLLSIREARESVQELDKSLAKKVNVYDPIRDRIYRAVRVLKDAEKDYEKVIKAVSAPRKKAPAKGKPSP